MSKLKVHVLYEYGENFRPHASASLRLLRPLKYPSVREAVDVTFGTGLGDAGNPDLVLVDRLWRPDIQPEMAHRLADDVHRRGAKLSFWFDDHFLALEGIKPIPAHLLDSFRAFLDVSDSCVVSTPALKAAFEGSKPVLFLPSALDERIVVRKAAQPGDDRPLVIGYMGSATHDQDLALVLPALQEISDSRLGKIRFEILGAVHREKLEQWDALKKLPVSLLAPMSQENEYPMFMLWFTGTVCWDLAIAPLVDNSFNIYKSDIKFLDYTAAGVPGIFSKVAPYSGTVEHDNTGLLVENNPTAWVDAIDRLAREAPLRRELLRNAEAYLYQHRTLAQCAGNWVETLQALSD